MVKAGNKTYRSGGELPETVPVFPLTGALLLPGGQMPLNIFEPRYLEMIDDAMSGSKVIGMVQPCLKTSREGQVIVPLCNVGCLGRISALQETGDGRYLISLSGICRYQIIEEVQVNTSYRQCNVKIFDGDLHECQQGISQDEREKLLDAFRNFLDANCMDVDWDTVDKTDNETLVTALCMMCPYDPAEKQALLEASDLRTRTETLIAISEIHLARHNSDDGSRLQ
ncbi:MAG: LON peptidase substrate-binding domain-containing protein [Rhizobiaceae bacterium]